MLQQTQVDTVIPYFNRFLSRFPTVHDLAAAPLDDVLKLWEGLGYYSRARNLHKAAKYVSEELKGELPSDYKGLQTIPGIGPYCAAAITSIAFGNPVPVVDGNVFRVFTRFWGIYEDIKLPATRNMLFDRLTPEIQHVNPSLFNQGIMELGALICSPKQPKCDQCPLSGECFALKTNTINDLPVKAKAKPVPHHNIAVGVIWKDDKLLIGKRKADQMLGGLWEFPGGKQKEKESLQDTVIREIKEETSLDVEIEKQYCSIKHAYSHFKITLHVFKCRYKSGKEQANTTDEVKWISIHDIDTYAFPKANIKALDIIKEEELTRTLL
jgi:A/G-specific adenine glycosylase